MTHNLNLNDLAAETVASSLADISAAVTEARRHIQSKVNLLSAREFDARYSDLRAYLGTVFNAMQTIDAIVFHTAPDDDDYGIVRDLDDSILRHPSQGRTEAIQRALTLIVNATPDTEHVEADRPIAFLDVPGNPTRVYGIDCDDDCTCKGERDDAAILPDNFLG
jgi:hypothetical protein